MERQYFIRYTNSNLFDPSVAVLTKTGSFHYGATALDGGMYRHYPVPAEDIALFTKEEAECIVKAFMDLFINGMDLCGEELSCHHISTLEETEDLARECMRDASMLVEKSYAIIGEQHGFL